MTVTFVFPNSSKSALISKVFVAPLWHPPIPPVTKKLIPAKFAKIIVAETVVAPHNFIAVTIGISLLETLIIPFFFPNSSISSGVIPMMGSPSMIPIVAGTAPLSLTVFSTAKAHSTFLGYGIPWEMIVDSKATTGFPSWIAFKTSGLIFILKPLFFPKENYR